MTERQKIKQIVTRNQKVKTDSNGKTESKTDND